MAGISEKDHTRYEKTRIIGARALQLSMGAPMMITFSEKELQGETLFPSAPGSRQREFTVSEFMPKPDLRTYNGYPGFDASVFSYGLTAIRYNGYKLIWATTGKHEFYNLTSDPGETINIYDDTLYNSEALKELGGILKQWQESSDNFSINSCDPNFSHSVKGSPVISFNV